MSTDPPATAGGTDLLQLSPSHTFVVWSTAAFRRNPVDDLVWIHDVARFAVYAVGKVYLQTPPSVAAILNHFIDSRDRKSTRLNSSHSSISYAVFCLKKKNISEFQYSF